MSNGIENFEIQLDNPTATYSPGEIISGKLIIELSRRKSLRALKLRFKGECQVHWTEHRGGGSKKQTHHYNGTETYFRTDICVLGNADGDTIEMDPGHQVFPFSYNLPHNIPSSYEHHLGYIRYNIKAIFDRPWNFDHTVSKFITIETPFEWESSTHQEMIGIDEEINKAFHCCILPCFKVGNMSLGFRIPTTFFECGDSIEATIDIHNRSDNIDVRNITMKLEKRLDFLSLFPSKTKSDFETVQKANKSGPFAKNTEVKIGLQVPALPFLSFKYCKLIDIKYRLHIGVHVSGCHLSTKRVYDVFIGTKSTLPPALPQQSFTPRSTNNLAPSAPQLTLDQNFSSPHPMQPPTLQYNFPMPNQNSADLFFKDPVPIPTNNPPYPPAMFPGPGGFSYPPENIHQPLPNIGFVCPQPTSSRDNSNEPPPPSYDSVMESGQKSFYS